MQKQYGTIPYYYDQDELKVVLITSASGYWIFPKGQFEKDLGRRGTAKLEALEEAGVEGRIKKSMVYRTHVHIKSGEEVRLTLFALAVETIYDEWPEMSRRKRKFVSLKKAYELISSDNLKKCLRKFERDVLD